MAEFTKEQLIERARENVESLKFASTQHAFEKAFPAIEIDIRLAEIALAGLMAGMDQEPVGITDRSEIEGLKRGEMANVMPPDFKGVDAGDEVLLYAAPQLPQPAVPDDVMTAIQKVARIRLDLNGFDGDRRGIADCLGEAEEDLIEVVNRRAAMLQGAELISQPDELPDGWVAVPVEPTEDMILSAMRDNETGEVSEIYQLMIAAAPQQEV